MHSFTEERGESREEGRGQNRDVGQEDGWGSFAGHSPRGGEPTENQASLEVFAPQVYALHVLDVLEEDVACRR